MALRQQHRHLGIRQQEGQPVRRVLRIQRQIGATSLQDSKHGDCQIKRALDTDRHHHIRPHTAPAQHCRHTRGPLIELPVCQCVARADHRQTVRCAHRLLRKECAPPPRASAPSVGAFASARGIDETDSLMDFVVGY